MTSIYFVTPAANTLAGATTPTTTATTSPAPATNGPPTLSGGDATWVIAGLLVLMAFAVAIPAILSFTNSNRKTRSQDKQPSNAAKSFFEIPYITWYLLHMTIASLGLLVIAALAVDNILDTATVGTLVGSLFGYVLGASTANRANQTASGPAPANTAPHPAVTSVTPNKGHPNDTLMIDGSGLGAAATVTFGAIPAVGPPVISPTGTLAVRVPAPPVDQALPFTVDVTITGTDGKPIAGGQQAFTYLPTAVE
jgi:hypothetical protein